MLRPTALDDAEAWGHMVVFGPTGEAAATRTLEGHGRPDLMVVDTLAAGSWVPAASAAPLRCGR